MTEYLLTIDVGHIPVGDYAHVVYDYLNDWTLNGRVGSDANISCTWKHASGYRTYTCKSVIHIHYLVKLTSLVLKYIAAEIRDQCGPEDPLYEIKFSVQGSGKPEEGVVELVL